MVPVVCLTVASRCCHYNWRRESCFQIHQVKLSNCTESKDTPLLFHCCPSWLWAFTDGSPSQAGNSMLFLLCHLLTVSLGRTFKISNISNFIVYFMVICFKVTTVIVLGCQWALPIKMENLINNWSEILLTSFIFRYFLGHNNIKMNCTMPHNLEMIKLCGEGTS